MSEKRLFFGRRRNRDFLYKLGQIRGLEIINFPFIREVFEAAASVFENRKAQA